LVFTARLCPQVWMPSSRICGQNPRNDTDATFLDPHISVVDCRCAACYNRREVAEMANFKMYLLRQFCLKWVEFFLQYTVDTDAKNDGPEFWHSICDFWEFYKFSKRRCAVPMRPIWTIMVTAKLDQSRVLVTKFHQNRSMLKGRSASQRQTDRHTHIHRQTNAGENKGPSGLQSGQQQTIKLVSSLLCIDQQQYKSGQLVAV